MTVPQVGSYPTAHATFGIGATGPEKFATGRWTGGMTAPEWAAYFRQPAKVRIPGRPGTDYNRLLGHVWPSGQSPGPKAAKPRAARPGPSRTKAAMAPKPKPAPEPVPTAGLTAELLHQAADLVPTALLYSESKAWSPRLGGVSDAPGGPAINPRRVQAAAGRGCRAAGVARPRRPGPGDGPDGGRPVGDALPGGGKGCGDVQLREAAEVILSFSRISRNSPTDRNEIPIAWRRIISLGHFVPTTSSRT